MKVETDIFSASLTGLTVMLVIMYVQIFKTNVIVFICDIKICLTSHCPIIFNISQFLLIRVTTWPNIFVDQGQFSDPDFISSTHQRKNVKFVDKTFSGAHLYYFPWYNFFLLFIKGFIIDCHPSLIKCTCCIWFTPLIQSFTVPIIRM